MERQQTIGQHLLELRKRVLISAGSVVVGTAVALIFYKQIVRVLLLPAEGLGADNEAASLIFIELTEMIAVTVKVSLLAGMVLAFPVVLYQIIMFVAPRLSGPERRYLLTFMPGVVLSFIGGVTFGYFVLIPPAVDFLLNWGSDLATPMIRIGNYITVMVTLLFWLGMVFETPVVMFLLAKLRIVSWRGYARWRRYWVVVAFVVGALITPTFDPVNQSLVAVPLIMLYEVGIWLARFAARSKPQSIVEVVGPGS